MRSTPGPAFRFLACVLGLYALPAGAETVFVNAAFGEIGNGWLFGSRSTGACWIALPWHVVGPMDQDKAAPFAFRDQAGRSGETGPSLRVTSVPGALEAASGVDDLAFAPVVAGRKAGDCISRLGLPAAGYVEVLNASPVLNLTYMQEGATVTFGVTRHRATTDDAQGSRFLLRPLDQADAAYLQGGLSGATVLLDWQGNPLPAAMVLEVKPQEGMAVAVRFDRIRASFETIEASSTHSSPGSAPGAAVKDGNASEKLGIGFQITGLLATPAEGSAVLSALGADGCWCAGPPARAKTIEILMEVTDPVPVAEIRLRADPACGPATVLTLEVNQGGGWNTISTACSLRAEPTVCRIGVTGPVALRLRTRPASGFMGISALSLN